MKLQHALTAAAAALLLAACGDNPSDAPEMPAPPDNEPAPGGLVVERMVSRSGAPSGSVSLARKLAKVDGSPAGA